MKIQIHPHGVNIEVVLDDQDHKGGTIATDLRKQFLEPGGDDDYLEGTIDILESLILAHACAGVDVGHPAYVAGLETTLEKLSNLL